MIAMDQTPPSYEPRVIAVAFSETLQAEIKFSDGRQIVLSGKLAAGLRDAVQSAVREGIAEAKAAAPDEAPN